ncbi:peptide/nickel transport system permease protein [Rhizobium sp. BK226]|uniref:ABC transporter permease n=1 Tax=Rhizobium indigoferae TaxID=158891 RepID=A0ABZ1DU92_9HYPH|nr:MULTISPECIES: ABC transporter permease [Rhizobium]MBB4112809.1 peptide/nickel transport system permease protein [Rhizobium sp. BK226]NNU52564.1 ABC transporter permease [Rhizobium indigoferae]WRW39334.1 ABC transporter permease [Rhizobium indigoferae]GLR55880.1 peptide ABC transporter permease [Rhizobium indigoferae]
MNSHKLGTYAAETIDLAPPARAEAARPATQPTAQPRWTHIHAPDVRASAVHGTAWRGLRRELKVFLSNPNALFGVAFLLVVALSALLAPLIYPGDPMEMVARPFLWPGQNATYPLGTDSMGRDVLAGILHGARISLTVGIAATLLGLSAGILIGAVAGYFGGLVDDILVKFVEIFQTIPSFVLLVVLVAIAQPTTGTVTVAIAIVSWPTVARLTRAEFRAIREKDYVLAARSLGFGHARIIFREILPNALPPLIVTSSVMVASAILMESALSFMGLGDPNRVSWGSMIGAGRDVIRTAWYLTALPGLAIVFTVLALNLIGDGLNDALNPRFSEER